ncbi:MULTISPECIES: hypothetical protein [Lactobacillales]|uniref:hypothetical protein n=1 Tax=Lactobacillales TaxID=186826 RepID=UPI000A191BDF|nr:MULTISPECIES: hypothetical protein [Lactobacillales]RXS50079.1 hypothetical protein ES032_13685 [Lactococcus lactis]TBX31422.1 hypothetical protein EUZ95_08495 [Enterococcus durans]
MVGELLALGNALKGIVNSGVADQAISLISTVKEGQDSKKTINAYEDAFNKLIHENQELKSIALRYKDEYDQIYLSETDIEYLQKTATRLINMFMPEVSDKSKRELRESLLEQGHKEEEIEAYVKDWAKNQEEQRTNFEQLVDLIQVDTLRTMQLLGFNYRQAIGEPLTEITAKLIANSLNEDSQNKQ